METYTSLQLYSIFGAKHMKISSSINFQLTHIFIHTSSAIFVSRSLTLLLSMRTCVLSHGPNTQRLELRFLAISEYKFSFVASTQACWYRCIKLILRRALYIPGACRGKASAPAWCMGHYCIDTSLIQFKPLRVHHNHFYKHATLEFHPTFYNWIHITIVDTDLITICFTNTRLRIGSFTRNSHCSCYFAPLFFIHCMVSEYGVLVIPN